MNSAKIENLLNLALDVSEQERQQSSELSVGFDETENTWEVIVRYFGTLQPLQEEFPEWRITELLNEYAIIRLPASQIGQLAELPQIEYIEKPKQLYFEVAQGRGASCMLPVQTGRGAAGSETNLTGKGVLVAVVDSGERVIIMRRKPGMEGWPETNQNVSILFVSYNIGQSRARIWIW